MKKKTSFVPWWIIPLIGIILLFLPGDYNCTIRQYTGIPCPGCGMTRAALYLLQLEFAKAFKMQPMIYLLIFYIVLLSVRSIAGLPIRKQMIFCAVSYTVLAFVLWAVRFHLGTLPY